MFQPILEKYSVKFDDMRLVYNIWFNINYMVINVDYSKCMEYGLLMGCLF